MIKAEHKKWALAIFNFYLGRLLKKHFGGFLLANEPPFTGSNTGLLVTPNHFSWWDGFFVDYLFKKISNRKMHIMMLEEQLAKYWFFKNVGAYSIKLESPKEIIKSFEYTKEVLTDPGNFVVVYPQGKIEPYSKKPIQLKKGIDNLLKLKNNNVNVLPLAFKIEFGTGKLPYIIARFGQVFTAADVADNFSNYEIMFNENLELLNKAIHSEIKRDLFR